VVRFCFLFTMLLSTSLTAKEIRETDLGYRVIRTNPQDFVNALRSPIGNSQSRNLIQSRLDKFYKIKSKEVNGQDVTIEVLPQIPILSDYFPQSRSLKVRLNEKFHLSDRFSFDALITLKSGAYLKSQLELSRCEAGTLLKLTLKESSYSSVTLQIFREAAEALGFVYPTERLAIESLKESAPR
jgi:hypothetical protein